MSYATEYQTNICQLFTTRLWLICDISRSKVSSATRRYCKPQKNQNPLVTARVDPNNSITLMIEQERNRCLSHRPLDNQHDSQTKIWLTGPRVNLMTQNQSIWRSANNLVTYLTGASLYKKFTVTLYLRCFQIDKRKSAHQFLFSSM